MYALRGLTIGMSAELELAVTWNEVRRIGKGLAAAATSPRAGATSGW